MFRPQEQIEAAALKRGLRALNLEVVFATISDTMMVGTLLTTFALYLGAQPAQVGMLATITFWAQLLQAPGVLLVERLRRRKLIAVVALVVSTAAPAAMAALAFAEASRPARMALVAAVAVYCGAGAISGCAWNAWTRDLIPRQVRGRLLGDRSRLGIATSVIAGFGAAVGLDLADAPQSRTFAFAALFGLAGMAQLLNIAALTKVPEPAMPPAPARPERLVKLLRRPLSDARFMPLIRFSASWQFAVNLAQPFFTVFFLQQVGLGVTLVMGFTIVSQLANGWALKRWGPLTDRFGDKSVLNLCAPLYIACIAAMVGASQLHPRWLVVVYLVALHVLMGVAGSGVGLASGNIALKLSPRGAAAPYLSAHSLIPSITGGLAPLLGGFGAEFFARRHASVEVHWSGPVVQGDLVTLGLTGWHFYFIISALCGLYALHRLALVPEDGALAPRELRAIILARARARFTRPTAVAGAVPPEDLAQDLLADEPLTPEDTSG
jgi:MFS family permease